MKHAVHKGKSPMPPKKMGPEMMGKATHPMPGGEEMHGEHHPTGKPAPKKVIGKRKR